MIFFDSYNETVISEIPEQIGALLRTRKKVFFTVSLMGVNPTRSDKSALHAIANLTELPLEQDSYKNQYWKWKEEELGRHLIECIEKFSITPFPKIKTSKVSRFFLLPHESWDFDVVCLCRKPIIEKSPYESNKKPTWVQCSNVHCNRWFHLSCALMLENNLNSIQNPSWLCLI